MNKYFNPINYWQKLIFYTEKLIYYPRYNLDEIKSIELKKFEHYNFDYHKALSKINDILESIGQESYYKQTHMASVHWLLFCAISQSTIIKNILEIGTFDGKTTLILSKIFPDAKITTIDLPDDDPLLTTTYQRDDAEYLNEFLEKQQQNTFGCNINLVKKNSFFLPEVVDEKFDLIWVDGGHLYPEISWDICNAYHLCNDDGWIMFDDIIPNQKYKPEGGSPDAYNVLEYIKQRMHNKITYFLKRDNIEFSANPRKRKFVALMNKANP